MPLPLPMVLFMNMGGKRKLSRESAGEQTLETGANKKSQGKIYETFREIDLCKRALQIFLPKGLENFTLALFNCTCLT